MDKLEIVVPGASGEVVLSRLTEKMVFGHQNG